jgi:hypothetical protein
VTAMMVAAETKAVVVAAMAVPTAAEAAVNVAATVAETATCGGGGNGNSCGRDSGMIDHLWAMSGHKQSRRDEIVSQIVPQLVPKPPKLHFLRRFWYYSRYYWK